MTAVLLGATSQVGHTLVQADPGLVPVCSRHCRWPAARDMLRLDIERREAVHRVLARLCPSLVIHAAGVCDVDRCETDPAWAEAVNVQGTRYLLEALPPSCRLLYISSDHVFGAGGRRLDERSRPRPLSVYGRCRVAAEALVRQHRPDALIVRPGLVIGPSLSGRSGHLDWLRHRLGRGLPCTVVVDEYRHAMAGPAVARRIADLLAAQVAGTVHLHSRAIDRSSLAGLLCRRLGLQPRLDPATRAQQAVPHLGRIDLTSRHRAAWARPLTPAWVDDLPDA